MDITGHFVSYLSARRINVQIQNDLPLLNQFESFAGGTNHVRDLTAYKDTYLVVHPCVF